jgi:hypothetical protein
MTLPRTYQNRKYKILIDVATCLLEAGIAEPKETPKKRLCKYVSTATKSSNVYITTHVTRVNIGSSFFYWVRAEAI